MSLRRSACLQDGPWPRLVEAGAERSPASSRLRPVAGGLGRGEESVSIFEIEWEVEYEGAAYSFRLEVPARDEDDATDRALVMLERARVADVRRKVA